MENNFSSYENSRFYVHSNNFTYWGFVQFTIKEIRIHAYGTLSSVKMGESNKKSQMFYKFNDRYQK